MEEKYVERLIETEQRSKSNTKRLDEHEEKLNELSNVYVALTKVDDKVTNVENKVNEMGNDIKDIKEKPNKKMDMLWGYVMTALIGGIITFIFIKLGMK